jgi:hypothetical protein
MAAGRIVPSEGENNTKEQDVYVTYDIDETGGGRNAVLYRAAKKIPIRGRVISWVIGEFKIRDVEEVYGVNLRYQAADGGGEEKEEIVNTSKYAQNIQVFVGRLPAIYQEALQRSA